MSEFGRGVRMLFAGVGWWRRDAGVMSRALLPGVIAAVIFAAALLVLFLFLGDIVTALTPFADGWAEVWASALRVAAGVALAGGALVLAAVSFTAVALLIGEPFYDRVWRSVEQGQGGAVPHESYGWVRAAADSLRLLVRGILVALVTGAVGLVPVVGAVLGGIVGLFLGGWLLADELSSRALSARGLDRRSRRRMIRAHRARVLGFGAATQLCFLVPLGAIAVMPAAVAGSTLLAQSLVAEPAPSPAA